MSVFLIFVGFLMILSFWLIGLRPYLISKGKQRSGADFFQSILADLNEGKELTKKGDFKANAYCRLIKIGFLIFIVGVLLLLL